MPISSNRRQRVIEYSTPKVADLVVVERVDCSKNVSSADAADDTYGSDYGDAHPDTNNFSGFKLALIKNGDNEQGQFQDWYYIKDRTDQDKYNWEFQAAGANNPRFDTVVRTYVLPRKLGVGLGGITHFDEALPLLTSAMPTTTNDPFGASDFSTSGTDGSYILFEKKQVRSGDEFLDTLFVVEQRVYVKRVTIRSVDADKEFPYMGYQTGATPYGGLISKETLFHKDEAVKATTVFLDDSSTTAGVSNTLHDVNGDGDGDNVGRAEFVFSMGKAFYKIGTTPYALWGIDEFGIMREGKQLSDNWYVLFEREVIKKHPLTNVVASYHTTQNMGWPAVFTTMFTQLWPRRDGSKQMVMYPCFKREAYEGPTMMQITKYWRKEPFGTPSGDGDEETLSEVKPMEPMAMNFTTPMFDVKVKKSLHEDYGLVYTTGSDDAEWEYIVYTGKWAATNYTDWPLFIVISDSQEPHRGGYLRTKVGAYSPNGIGRATWDSDAGHVPVDPTVAQQ